MDTATMDLDMIVAEKFGIDSQAVQDQEPSIQPLATNGSVEGANRPAEAESNQYVEAQDNNDADSQSTQTSTLSKNQQRKLKRRQMWAEGKADRIHKRKQKRHDRQERKRLEREAEIALAAKEGREPVFSQRERHRNPAKHTKVPVAIIIDCQFEKYMRENEVVSLSNQVTRSYSDNRAADFPVHLYISSYGGQMKERYENVLKNHHKSWKGVTFTEDDFVETAKQAIVTMITPEEGKSVELIELLKANEGKEDVSWVNPDQSGKSKTNDKSYGPAPTPEPEPEDINKSIVYLTADSPYTLNHLEPNTCYVVGGIIDRNREKGLCYKVARERKVRTAKLPIGEYMILRDRHVLATNHVVEIMLRWLELGDWGAAFMKVIPARKGGTLKEGESVASEAGPEIDEDVEDVPDQAQAGKLADIMDFQSSLAGQETQQRDRPAKRKAGIEASS